MRPGPPQPDKMRAFFPTILGTPCRTLRKALVVFNSASRRIALQRPYFTNLLHLAAFRAVACSEPYAHWRPFHETQLALLSRLFVRNAWRNSAAGEPSSLCRYADAGFAACLDDQGLAQYRHRRRQDRDPGRG